MGFSLDEEVEDERGGCLAPRVRGSERTAVGVEDAQHEVGLVLAGATELFDRISDGILAHGVGGAVEEELCLAIAKVTIERPHDEARRAVSRRHFG